MRTGYVEMHRLDSEPYGSQRPRVLIAEDDGVVRLILQSWIEGWGYESVTASNGSEAWEILQQERPPEVVIMDWMMPGIDGIELCRRLRDKSREYYPYILMITGRTDHLDVVHALESGADDCISKPFEELDLRARLIVASRILALQNELIHSREELRVQAMRDALTGLWNRTAFLDLFKCELDRAERTRGRTGLMLLDLDNFKGINDRYGHLAGDMVLKEAARRLKQNIRSYDFVGRYGGEEFLLALPGCDGEQLRQRAETIRQAMCKEPVRLDKGEINITVSIGAVVAPAGEGSIWDVMAVADIALYRAKTGGRNCAVLCEKPWVEILQSPLTHHDCCAGCEVGRTAECIVSIN
jgi:diguanylate cyclase (GGDEF)-like protein